MFKKLFVLFSLILILTLSVSAVQAGESDPATDPEPELETDYPWRGHAAPFNFMFNNGIDTHQQSRLNGNGVLHGFIYIHIIGMAEDAIPIAEKADCAAYPDECVVGWVVKGIPYSATLVHKGPRIWLVDPAGLPMEPGYLHFHWLGNPYKPHGLALDTVMYDGYLLKRVAATTFYWRGGNGQGGSGCGGGSREDHTDGDCTGDDHTGETGGCSGGCGEMGGGTPGHGGRLVIEGLDLHSNITTEWDGTWQGGCEED